ARDRTRLLCVIKDEIERRHSPWHRQPKRKHLHIIPFPRDRPAAPRDVQVDHVVERARRRVLAGYPLWIKELDDTGCYVYLFSDMDDVSSRLRGINIETNGGLRKR